MADVQVTVETPSENQIIAVEFDGREIIQPPLTLAEHFAKQASRLDFNEIEDEGETDPDTTAEEDQEEDENNAGITGWPWESTRNKLNDALTELSVLQDVISVCTNEGGKDPVTGQPKRYMILDGPIHKEPVESKPLVSLLSKKKSLDAPAKILLTGAEQLKTLLQSKKEEQGSTSRSNLSMTSSSTAIPTTSSSSSGRNVEDFHFELLRLRQNWRLKKVSNTILGDLSYRTAGSQYKQSGVFEVVKAVDIGSKSDSTSSNSINIEEQPGTNSQASIKPHSTGFENSAQNKAPKSVLRVNVPSELEGIAFIQVVIQKESEQLVSTNLTQNMDAFGGAISDDVHWQQKLEAAQNVLFCKELFSQLAREAIQLQAPIPHMVVGNQITACLFPDIQLLITLCHSTKPEAKQSGSSAQPSNKSNGSDTTCTQAQYNQQRDHSHVLEHSLHQLLRLAHQKNINPDHAGLSTAPVGIPKRRRLAGPGAASRKELLEMATQETLLEQIIRQAQHVVLRLRTMFVLDTMARELKDPLISCHWGTLSSPTRTSVKVIIMTAGYDTILRTQLVIHVGEKQLTVVCKDGRVLHFSHEPQELRDFILCQISQHQINGVQALAKCTGWQMLSSSTYHLGCGVVEPLGNAAGCLLQSTTGDKFIAVRHSPQTQTAVYIASAPCRDFFAGSIVKDANKWENLPEAFQELRLEKMDGKNLLNKLELLMAALSNSGSN